LRIPELLRLRQQPKGIRAERLTFRPNLLTK
jgi:hypothetical protein